MATAKQSNTLNNTPARLSDRLYAEVEELEQQLEELPARVRVARDRATEEVDDQAIAAALEEALTIETKTIPALKIKIWQRRRDYLQAHRADLITLELELRDGAVAAARGDLTAAEAALDAARTQFAVAERRHKALAGEMRQVGIRLKDLEGEIQKHERSKPTFGAGNTNFIQEKQEKDDDY